MSPFCQQNCAFLFCVPKYKWLKNENQTMVMVNYRHNNLLIIGTDLF